LWLSARAGERSPRGGVRPGDDALESLHVLDPTALEELALPVKNGAQRAETLVGLEDVYRHGIASVAAFWSARPRRSESSAFSERSSTRVIT
jgi:hypothetical protein